MNPTIEHEIEQARNDGVSHPENLPFLLTPEQPSQHGILLVHGFSSTPREMRALAEHLLTRNFTVLGIRLPGHGTSPEDLAKRKNEEWLAAAERGYQILRHLKLRVSAVGLSTGCLVLLQLSLRHPIERQVLLSPYLRFKHPLAPLAGALSYFIPYQQRQIDDGERPFYYQRRPLKGIAQLNKLKNTVKKNLRRITTPTLVVAAKGDQTVDPDSAKELYERLASKDKNLFYYGNDVPHVLTTTENPRQKDVFQRTSAFLENLYREDSVTAPQSFTQ